MKNYTYMYACMHAGAPLSWKPVAPEGKLCKKRKNMKNFEKKSTYLHACMLGHPSAGSRLHLGKHAEKLLKNYTYMHACMHAGAPLSWKPVTPEENMQKNHWKITDICMHACMLGHPSAGSRLQLKEIVKNYLKK